MKRLSGHYYASIDAKRRLYLPAELQKPFDGEESYTVYVGRPSTLKCIWILTQPAWRELDALFEDDRYFHVLDEGSRSNYFRHALSSFKTELMVNGRIPLSEAVLKWAGLDPKVTDSDSDSEFDGRALVIGLGKRIEVWHPDAFAETLDQPMEPPAFLRPTDEQVLTKFSGQGEDDSAT